MPTWSEILTELKVESAQGNSAPFDFIRRKYLSELSKYTNRNIILYATAFTQKGGAPELLSVTEEDVQGAHPVIFIQLGIRDTAACLVIRVCCGQAVQAVIKKQIIV